MMKSMTEIRSYEIGRGFMLDLTVSRDTYDAWIWRQGFGVKELFYSCLKSRISEEAFLAEAERMYPEQADKYAQAYAG